MALDTVGTIESERDTIGECHTAHRSATEAQSSSHVSASERRSAAQMIKDARAVSGKSIADIAQESCVSQRYLIAIEQHRYDELPELAFAVGFVRAFALSVGADPDDVVARFKGEIRSLEAERRPETVTVTEEPRRGLMTWFAPVSGMIATAFTLVWFGSGVFVTTAHVASDSEEVVQLSAIQSEMESPRTGFVANMDALTPAAHADTVSDVDAGFLHLAITSSEDSWVRLSTPDGLEHWSGILEAGQTFTPRLEGETVISASNIAALSVVVDDQTLDLSGQRGQVLIDAQLSGQ